MERTVGATVPPLLEEPVRGPETNESLAAPEPKDVMRIRSSGSATSRMAARPVGEDPE
jgi:hypothetical protein